MGLYTEKETQQTKLYRAERVLEKFSKPLPTVKDVERYVARQLKRQTLKRRYGIAVDISRWDFKVKDGRGRRHAGGWAGGIIMPLWCRNDWIALHELAHTIHQRITKSYCGGERAKELVGGSPHGWQYAAIYLDLVRFCMGKEAHDALKASFKANKVRYLPKRTIPIEVKEVLVEAA